MVSNEKESSYPENRVMKKVTGSEHADGRGPLLPMRSDTPDQNMGILEFLEQSRSTGQCIQQTYMHD